MFLFKDGRCLIINRLTEWTLYYFVIYKCMNITVRYNSTVQFTFFLVMRLNINIISKCPSFFVILVCFLSLKFENGIRNTFEASLKNKISLVILVVIFNLYCELSTFFTPCSRVSILNFELVNAGWEVFSCHFSMAAMTPSKFEIFLMLPNFLRSSVLSRSASPAATRMPN